ncbi:MAG: hypothetical protein WCP28_11565 [Actinomycetes bacterium]
MSARAMSRMTALGVCAAAATGLTGCTQLAQLQPVAGDEIASVQFATSDVLAAKKVDVIVWPTCSFASKVYTCTGTAAGGKTIVATAPAVDPVVLTVKVADVQIFTGKIDELIQAEGRMP